MIKYIFKNYSVLFLALIIFFIFSIIPVESREEIIDFTLEHEGLLYLCLLGLAIFIAFLPTIISKKKKPKYIKNISLENAPIEFKTIYDSLYSSNIEELEVLRKKAKARKIIQTFLLIIIFIGYVFMDSNRTIISLTADSVVEIIAILALIIFAIHMYINHKSKDKYKLLYKNNIVSKFVKLVNDNLTYSPDKEKNGNLSDKYIEANFDDKAFNTFYNDDNIEGNIEDNIYINANDIHVQNITGSGKYQVEEELFKGIFTYTKPNKNINSFIKISKNKRHILNNDAKIAMDDTTFEKYFDVYSQDKLLTMRILTSDIMTSLMDFYRKYELEFEIIFRNDTIYLRFFTGEMFEPKLFGNSMDKELLLVYYEILKFVVDVTKKINITLQEIEL